MFLSLADTSFAWRCLLQPCQGCVGGSHAPLRHSLMVMPHPSLFALELCQSNSCKLRCHLCFLPRWSLSWQKSHRGVGRTGGSQRNPRAEHSLKVLICFPCTPEAARRILCSAETAQCPREASSVPTDLIAGRPWCRGRGGWEQLHPSSPAQEKSFL